MAQIEIIEWNEDIAVGTAWDSHIRSELKKRLHRGVVGPSRELNHLFREINKHRVLTLNCVHDEALDGVSQILEAMGAKIRVVLGDGKISRQLFKKLPDR